MNDELILALQDAVDAMQKAAEMLMDANEGEYGEELSVRAEAIEQWIKEMGGMNNTLYTVYKCKSKTSDDRVGSFHGSDDGEVTLCGRDIDTQWYIVNNTFTGMVTCEKCLKVIRERDK